MHSKEVSTIVLIIVAFIGIALFMASLLRDAKMDALLNDAASRTMKGENVTETDLWGMPLQCMVESDRESTVATAVSSGPDKTLGTADDLTAECIDLNVTYKVGKWAGSTSKELAKGVWKGVIGESEAVESPE